MPYILQALSPGSIILRTPVLAGSGSKYNVKEIELPDAKAVY